MKPEDASRVSINHCLTDGELDRAQAMVDDADPGAWRVAEGKVERYSDKPFEKLPQSLALMAASQTLVPRLIRGIRVLEGALLGAWNAARIAKREWSEEQQGREADALRRSEGTSGPAEEVSLLCRYVVACGRLDSFMSEEQRREARVPAHLSPDRIGFLLRRWAGGESLARDLTSEVESLEKQAVERAEFNATFEAEERAKIEDLQRWLREALDGIAEGRIVAELEKPLREAKKRVSKSA